MSTQSKALEQSMVKKHSDLNLKYLKNTNYLNLKIIKNNIIKYFYKTLHNTI
jgi:hypothetical protein